MPLPRSKPTADATPWIRCLTLSHHDAPAAIRQRFALGEAVAEALLNEIANEAAEFFALSTCNRTELYISAASEEALDTSERRLQASLVRHLQLAPEELGRLRQRDGVQAVRHLCEVACGLDSAVLGETEILRQIKQALRRSHATGAIGPTLHSLVHLALRCGRRARSETEIASGRVSVASAGLCTARDKLGRLGGLHVLLIGAGKMAQSALAHLLDEEQDTPPASLTIANRTVANAEPLLEKARAHGLAEVRAVPLEGASLQFARANIVVSALSSERPEPRFCAATLEQLPALPQAIVDLGLPPNVDASVAQRGGESRVHYIGVDSLDDTTSASRAARQAAVPAVQAILAEELAPFENANVALSRNVLDALFRRFSDVSRCEAASQAGTGLPTTQAELEAYSLRLVRRLLRPLVQHRDAAESAEALEAVAELFSLEEALAGTRFAATHNDATAEERSTHGLGEACGVAAAGDAQALEAKGSETYPRQREGAARP